MSTPAKKTRKPSPRRRKDEFNPVKGQRAEVKLRVREERNRQLLQQCNVAMIVTRGLKQRNELVNDRFTALFGYTIEDVPDVAHWWRLAYPDKAYRKLVKTEWQARMDKAISSGTDIEPMEATVRCKNGSFRHIEARLSSVGETSVVTLIDLTGRKQTEEGLKKSEEKFSKAFRRSPMALTLTSANDHRYIEVNETFERESGWRRDEIIGRTPFDIGIWVDPAGRVEIAKKILTDGSLRNVEAQFRMKDGSIRIALIAAEAIELNGEPCLITVGADITQRKLAEEELARVSRRLIEAQEQERARIARDLHDDIGQRLALLSNGLEQLQYSSDLPAEVSSRMGKLQSEASQIATDVQSLSHELHSSKLELLGMAAAVRGFCREFGEQQHVEINCKMRDLPSDLPPAVALCLFRVLQEALRNSLKHSGVKRFEVQLWGMPEEVHLTVSDSGSGFELKVASNSRGLGLVSMEERLKLVKGTLLIDSQPKRGTTIHARVPYQPT
jgi:PAS domain S-box-containing protein